MTIGELFEQLKIYAVPGKLTRPAVLIVNGTAYDIDDVWYEPRQNATGALCIGEDPR